MLSLFLLSQIYIITNIRYIFNIIIYLAYFVTKLYRKRSHIILPYLHFLSHNIFTATIGCYSLIFGRCFPMKKKQNTNLRISVTISLDLYRDFVERSRLSGLSISRIAYLQMKSRKPPIIVPVEILKGIRRIERLQKQLESGIKFAPETAEALMDDIKLLREHVDFHSAVVANKGGNGNG